jgi:hypothetical protein
MNDKGENLGKIEEFLIDLDTGRIMYAILSYGGFPNRSKFFTVPFELLRFSVHDKNTSWIYPGTLLKRAPVMIPWRKSWTRPILIGWEINMNITAINRSGKRDGKKKDRWS